MRPLEKVDSDAGWGEVPVIGGDTSTATPPTNDPTATTPVSDQQATIAVNQQSVASVALPPPPPPNACITAEGRSFTPSFYLWLLQLQKRVGGYIPSITVDDSSSILEAFDVTTPREVIDLANIYGADSRVVQEMVEFFSETSRNAAPIVDEFFGDTTPGNHLSVWNDWNLSVSGAKLPAANVPAWNTLVGNLRAYQFAVNDYLYLEAQEFLHNWKEGTDVQMHIHWVTGGLNDATARGVKWEVEYSICNPIEGAFGATAYTTTTVTSTEFTIPANQPDRTHRIGTIAVISGSQLRIGAQLIARLRRIAAAGTAPAANPFAISFGLHFEADTAGSRLPFTK